MCQCLKVCIKNYTSAHYSRDFDNNQNPHLKCVYVKCLMLKNVTPDLSTLTLTLTLLTQCREFGILVKSVAMFRLSRRNVQLTISASGPPKSRNIMRTPSSDDIRRRSKGCLSRTLFLTPISSVNSVKPSSMCTPRVHSLPFQLQAGEKTRNRGCYKSCCATKALFISKGNRCEKGDTSESGSVEHLTLFCNTVGLIIWY